MHDMENTIPELSTPDMLNGRSLNISEEKRRQLKAIFPEVFTEGEIDFDRLKAVLGELTTDGKEHYALTWAGKYDAFREIQKQTTATLIPDREKSIDFDATGNIFIEGENLEALRVLQKSYYGKVKMIYIDPPYNTGNDSFIYPDDFAERLDEYRKRTGITDEEGFLNKQDLWKKNTKENGQFHSVWLSMLYPRLYLARNLLRDDGVIFVSIDDNEVANLRLLMNEVFGEENFISSIVWHSKYTTANDAKYVSKQHEHILFYAKSINDFEIGLLDRTEDMDRAYKDWDNDPRGPWKATPLHAKSGSKTYSLTFPNGITWTTPQGRYPRYAESKLMELYNDNRIDFGRDGKGIPSVKSFLSEVKQGKTVGSIWSYNEVGSSHQANEQLAGSLGKGMFDNPKPLNLIKTCLKVANTQGDSIILDFFAGSGTTAQAVLDLNREDGGNRKFICVQLPEPTDEKSEARKAGYDTIADISRARIRKVIEKMNQENAGKLDLEKPGDLGFRSYRLAPSNFKLWRGTLDNAELDSLLLEFQDAHKEGADAENMLTELLLKAGFPLTAPVERLAVGGGTVWNVDNGKMVVLLERIDDAIRDYLLETKPAHVVCLDTVFEDNDQLLTNLGLQLREAGVELTVV